MKIALVGGLVAADFGDFGVDAMAGVRRLRSSGQTDFGFIDARPIKTRRTDRIPLKTVLLPTEKIITEWIHAKGYQVVRLEPNGAIDPSFATNAVANAPIDALTVTADGRIFMIGRFNKIGDQTRLGLAWLTPDGELLPDRPLLIESQRFTPAGEIEFSIHNRLKSNGAIESSSNLRDWTAVSALALPLGRSQARVRIEPGATGFYRIRVTP